MKSNILFFFYGLHFWCQELFSIIPTQDSLCISNISYVLQILLASYSTLACNSLQIFSFIFPLQHCPREHTHTLKHYKHRFPVSLWTICPPFPGLFPKMTKVTFSKVLFLSSRQKCWKIEIVSAIFMADHSRMSFWIPFLKIMQVEMAFWKLISSKIRLSLA